MFRGIHSRRCVTRSEANVLRMPMRTLILPVPVQAIAVDVGSVQQVAKIVRLEVHGVEGQVISRRWVYHFDKRHGLSNPRKITTERTPLTGSARH